MPYKHIAEHLKKTELACRLHFHQISFGNKRRRRAASITSMGSIDGVPNQPARQHGHETPQRRLPSLSPAPISPPNHSQSVDTSPESPSNSPTPILPKPGGISSQDGLPTNALRLMTENLSFPDKEPAINTARLTRLYHTHRLHFWSLIATDYGHNASPAALEEVWRKLSASPPAALPPTPSDSPHRAGDVPSVLDSPTSASTASSGFSPVNARQGNASAVASSAVEKSSFAIPSSLTEDKDVRGGAGQDRGNWSEEAGIDTR